MAVDAENTCFENMGFAPFPFPPSVLGIQEPEHLYYDFALPSSSSPVDISCEVEKQRVEMDWFIQVESKRLRRAILEEEWRVQGVIMQQYESRMRALMVQKDEEIAMARSRERCLEDLLKAAEMEARGWERAAREAQVLASDLNHRLNVDGAASFCDSTSGGGGESNCKLCGYGRSCVVLLPCRHLCCCKLCEPLLEHCPLCHTLKDSTLEAFWA